MREFWILDFGFWIFDFGFGDEGCGDWRVWFWDRGVSLSVLGQRDDG